MCAPQAAPLAAAAPAVKHWGPVWHLAWQQLPGQGELLFTSSGDGRFTQWSLSRVCRLLHWPRPLPMPPAAAAAP